ncbi:MAG: hypothetical protein FWE45_05275 [Firmicutes bacterium]|nr:hypothetical protein [Bacillota bacterium]
MEKNERIGSGAPIRRIVSICFAVAVLCVSITASIVLFIQDREVAVSGNVGDSIASENILVNILDRSFPVLSTTVQSWGISTRVTDVPVGLTISYINPTVRSMSFNVTVPSGYHFVFGAETDSPNATSSFDADIVRQSRETLQNGTFTNQLHFNEVNTWQWNRLINITNSRFHVFLVPIESRTVQLDTRGGNPIAPITLDILHPNALPTPTHPQGLPFMHWSATLEGASVTSAQLVNNVTLYAVWLHAPQNFRTHGTRYVAWDNVNRWATGIEVRWYKNGTPEELLGMFGNSGGITANRISLNNGTWGLEGWIPGNHQVVIRSSFGMGSDIQFSEWSAPITFTEQRTQLPMPTNVRLVNGNTLVWDHPLLTLDSPAISYQISDGSEWGGIGWTQNETFLRLEEPWMLDWFQDNDFIIRARCDDRNYFDVETGFFSINSIPHVTITQQLAAPTVTFDLELGHALRFPVNPLATGYVVYVYTYVDLWGGSSAMSWQRLDSLHYRTTAGNRILRDNHYRAVVEERNGYYYYYFSGHIAHSMLLGTMGSGAIGQTRSFAVRAIGDYVTYASSELGSTTPLLFERIQTEIRNMRIDGDGNFMWDARDFHFLHTNRIVFSQTPIQVYIHGVGTWEKWEPFSPSHFGISGNYNVTITIPDTLWSPVAGTSYTFSHNFVQVNLQLASPSLTRDGNILRWNAVENAERYRIYIDGEYLDTINSVGSVIEFNLDNLDPRVHGVGEVAINVIASTNGVHLDSEPATLFFNIAPIMLDTPEVYQYDENVFTWNAVENASEYAIYVNGNRVTTVTERTFDLVQLGLGQGTHQIRVRAIGTGNFSNSSLSQYLTFTVLIDGGGIDPLIAVLIFGGLVLLFIAVILLVLLHKRRERDYYRKINEASIK